MTHWNDFNNADNQNAYATIPKGTLVPVRMTLRPGGFDDPSQGWTGGYATQSEKTCAVYLDAEFVVTGGEYARRKIWSLIGLHSAKGPEWANMGRAFIKAILNSARGVRPDDASPQAQSARRITGFADLDGIEFLAKIDWEKDQHGQDKAVIKTAITPDHKDYAALMSGVPRASGAPSSAPATVSAPAYAAPAARAAVPSRPSWAQ